MPGSSRSHRLHTLPGMLIAIREMAQFGREYAVQTITNAKALGQALTDEGVNVEAKEFGFTERHQSALNVSNFGIAKELARSLSDKTTSSPTTTCCLATKMQIIQPVCELVCRK